MQKDLLEKEIECLSSSNKNLAEQAKKTLANKEKELNALQHLVDYYSGKLELDDYGKRLEAFKQTSTFIRIRQSIRFKDAAKKLHDEAMATAEEMYNKTKINTENLLHAAETEANNMRTDARMYADNLRKGRGCIIGKQHHN